MNHQIRWTIQKIQKRLEEISPLVYRQSVLIPPFRFRPLKRPGSNAFTDQIVDDSDWEVIPVNSYWGYPRTNFILRTIFCVPENWDKNTQTALYLPIGASGDFSHPEALAYIDGHPYASCDRHHQEIHLPSKWINNQTHTLALHGWTGLGGATVGNPNKKILMEQCEIVQIDQPTRNFLALARVSLEIAQLLEDNQPSKHYLLTSLDEAFCSLDLRIPIADEFYHSVPIAFQKLNDGIMRSGIPLDVDITAIGHAHIDIAWLWTLEQTRQKVGRTFYNVIRLMEEFPEFRFTQSQPQLYEFVQQDFPELFSEIKKRIKEGRWEPIGGMWVEADCNLPGAESLARQFLLGRNYFKTQFGENAESPVLWLPDVFGYTWNLPQLLKSAGMEYFFTIKIGWNQYNRLPYDSFWWQGLDGTRVLTHFSTTKDPKSSHASTYNSDASPGQVLGTWYNFQQKDSGPPGISPPLLLSYGWGDGGGGPTRKMLENLKVMEKFPATPKIKTDTVKQFFNDLEQSVGNQLPIWNGELYLEYHRGTYTTQARIKRANRKSEFLLHNAEFLAVYADLMDGKETYSSDRFTAAWKLVCLNQFHDIIPGSSIGPVYSEALEQYKQINAIGTEEQEVALQRLYDQTGGDFVIVNPTSFKRNEIVFIPEELKSLGDQKGQLFNSGTFIRSGDLPPYSVTPINIDSLKVADSDSFEPVYATTKLLENANLRVLLNEDGDITSIFDKVNEREVLSDGRLGNQFQAFEDRPLSWDAWDIDIFYDEKMWLANPASLIEVMNSGPLRASIKVTRKILNSEFIQIISLDHGSPQLNFKTMMNWRERKILLKVAFPVDVLSPTATYEIQWGNVERPTHRNTSWDWARFETSAQKWVDLSEGGYGVSLLNDCKYGHDIRDNLIRLTLLRGTTTPDVNADLGEHHFAYSLFPHTGRWNEKTIAAAYALNDPLIVYIPEKRINRKKELIRFLIKADQPNIVIETIKKAEDGNGIIIRLYESQRKRKKVTIQTGFLIQSASQVNLLENDPRQLDLIGRNQVELDIKPYQIVTLRIIPENEQ